MQALEPDALLELQLLLAVGPGRGHCALTSGASIFFSEKHGDKSDVTVRLL